MVEARAGRCHVCCWRPAWTLCVALQALCWDESCAAGGFSFDSLLVTTFFLPSQLYCVEWGWLFGLIDVTTFSDCFSYIVTVLAQSGLKLEVLM